MLRIFKQNDISSAFALVIITFLLKAKYILHPPALRDIEHFEHGLFFSFPSLKAVYTAHPSWYVFLSVCLMLGFALYLNNVVNREKFLPVKSFLPALSFLLFSSFSPVFNIFSMPFIANLFLFMAFSRMMHLYHIANPRRTCFDVGILVSLAALFYFPSILFLFVFLAILLLLRPFVFEENIAYILGILTPAYISVCILYITGNWTHLRSFLYLHLTPPVKIIALTPLVVMTVVSISMLVYGLFLINQASIKNAISVRKKWNAVVIYLFFACVIGIFSNTFPGVPWLLTITPISIIVSQTFLNHKEKYNTLTFYFLIAAVIVIQWMLQG